MRKSECMLDALGECNRDSDVRVACSARVTRSFYTRGFALKERERYEIIRRMIGTVDYNYIYFNDNFGQRISDKL